MKRYELHLVLFTFLLFIGCGGEEQLQSESLKSPFDSTNGYDIRTQRVKNPSAYIPSMCYTKTEDSVGVHNPCYVCHNRNIEPNPILENETLQKFYDFPAPARVNPFKNLFEDFSSDVSKISDDEITRYVNRSNYIDENGELILRKNLENLPETWDMDGDGEWSGYIPDCYYNFDENGFDRESDGSYTGWVAFAYIPFPGTFWPTNGSTDDVLIRLPDYFRKFDADGEFNATVYKVNLSIVESLVKREDVKIEPVDERLFGVDLDKDGNISIASKIKYDWAPTEGRQMYYVGAAKDLQLNGEIELAAGLFPKGTEFLHSVRYIKSDEKGTVSIAPRMKELRYAKKLFWLTYADLKNIAYTRLRNRDLNPERLESFQGNMEIGLSNGQGWVYQGFIEDRYGELRPQSYEETLNCMGCHSGITATVDSIFSYQRKIGDWRSGFYHWSQKSLKGVKEFKYSDGSGEFSTYLKLNGAGDEFRDNDEIKERFFLENGELNTTMVEKMSEDVSLLLYPSYERAIKLNKAYRALVLEQKFIDGRAAHVNPVDSVYKEVDDAKKSGIEVPYILP